MNFVIVWGKCEISTEVSDSCVKIFRTISRLLLKFSKADHGFNKTWESTTAYII